jgi:hypothetical protein
MQRSRLRKRQTAQKVRCASARLENYSWLKPNAAAFIAIRRIFRKTGPDRRTT